MTATADLDAMAALTARSTTGFVVVDSADHAVLWANPAAEGLLGRPLPPGRAFGTVAPGQRSLRGAGGHRVLAEVSDTSVDGRPARLLVLHDAKHVDDELAALQQAATTDHLTGLLHQRGLRERVQADGRRDHPISVLFIDLDRFKVVNDTWGHHVGDVVLNAVAQRLANVLRDRDLLARWGGDEFVIVTDTPPAAGRLADRIEATLAGPVSFPGGSAVVGASIGIATSTGRGWSLDDVVRQADRAMYRQKAGRDASSATDGLIDLRDWQRSAAR